MSNLTSPLGFMAAGMAASSLGWARRGADRLGCGVRARAHRHSTPPRSPAGSLLSGPQNYMQQQMGWLKSNVTTGTMSALFNIDNAYGNECWGQGGGGGHARGRGRRRSDDQQQYYLYYLLAAHRRLGHASAAAQRPSCQTPSPPLCSSHRACLPPPLLLLQWPPS
jgi:hypothetical protein